VIKIYLRKKKYRMVLYVSSSAVAQSLRVIICFVTQEYMHVRRGGSANCSEQMIDSPDLLYVGSFSDSFVINDFN
jgi:hypothetical protein